MQTVNISNYQINAELTENNSFWSTYEIPVTSIVLMGGEAPSTPGGERVDGLISILKNSLPSSIVSFVREIPLKLNVRCVPQGLQGLNVTTRPLVTE